MDGGIRMRCIYCSKRIVGNDGISVSGRGVCHAICHHMDQAQRRVYKGLDVTALTDQELTDLKEVVLTEENARYGGGDDDIELF